MNLVNESKAKIHLDKARIHRQHAQLEYDEIDAREGESDEPFDRASMLINAMEELSEATRHETYARMLVDEHDPMWRCIELQKAINAAPKKVMPPKPNNFNHKEFNRQVKLAQLHRDHQRRDKLKPLPSKLFR